MEKIYKYGLSFQEREYLLPKDAEVLSAGIQNGSIFIWAKFKEENEDDLEKFYFEIFGTGWSFGETTGGKREFFQTVTDGRFVWHIFRIVDIYH